ncbi:unnamed protein product [Hydatigera taeniaeformis]|uniref:HP domain-containing protein n=1 Tax=Hydatigena taeniaeformis TaxID=6205 RepID=A0A0R3WJ31_HYDTA|nr:unnamed protein product [Hydatigera taeniaeformis]
MGLSFSKSSTNTTAKEGEEHETGFQHIANTIRRSFRVKRQTADNANRSSLRASASVDGVTTTSTRVRPGIPESFHQQNTASVKPAAPAKETLKQPAKSPATPLETKAATPKAPEVIPAMAMVTEASRNAASISESQKKVGTDEERDKEMDKAMDMLKGAIRAEEEQGEKKADIEGKERQEEEKEKLHHVGDILSRLAPATTPTSPEAASAIAKMTEAPRNAAFIPESPEKVKMNEESDKDSERAMGMLKGTYHVEEEQGEKDDRRVKEGQEEDEEEEGEKLHHAGNILSQLAPADTSGDKTPETDTPAKPTVSLLAALEKRKAMKERKEEDNEESDEAEKDANLTHGVTNVLESIAYQSSAIKSKEAANLMAAFTLPPQSPSEGEVDEEEDRQGEKKTEKEEEEANGELKKEERDKKAVEVME